MGPIFLVSCTGVSSSFRNMVSNDACYQEFTTEGGVSYSIIIVIFTVLFHNDHLL